MRILIVGVGAVGGYFGGRLLAAQRDVTFLVRPHRAAELAANGLQIQSPCADVHLKNPPVVLASQISRPFDLILLSCKGHDLPGAMQDFSPAVGPDSAIIPLLNGMRHLEILQAHFGAERVLGGSCFISAYRDRDGRIVHFNDADRLSFGEIDGALSPRVRQITMALSDAGFDLRPSENILQDMWNKWVFIAAAAGITTLMGASIGEIVASGAANLAITLFQECTSIAAAEGFPLSPRHLQAISSVLTEAGSALVPSMQRDIEQGAAIEINEIIGDLVNRGRAHRVPAALLETVYARLRCYETRRTSAQHL